MERKPTIPLVPGPAQAAESAALARLLTAIGKVDSDAAGRRLLPDAELQRQLDVAVSSEIPLGDWVQVRLGTDDTLSPYQYGVLDASERVLTAFLAQPAFHPQLAAVVHGWRGAFAGAALAEDGWLVNTAHPVRRVLHASHAIACGWAPDLGSGADGTRQQLDAWLSAVATGATHWDVTADLAERWLADERRRTERLEKRLVDAEAGSLRARNARLLAARVLNQALGDRMIDHTVIEVIRQDWFAAMQWALLSEGEQGSTWQRVKRITSTLRWTLQPEGGDDGRQKLYRVITQLNEDLEAVTPNVIHDATARDRLLAALDAAHLRILRNEAPTTAPFPLVDGGDLLNDGRTAVSETLMEPVRQLAPGQWFVVREGGHSRRVRLLLRQDATQQLLFVNALGVKALATSFDAFALRIAAGDVQPLPQDDGLADAIASVLAALGEQQRRAQQDRMELIRQAREQAAKEARIREEARQKALAEAQALEAARQEAQKRAADVLREAETIAQDAVQQRMQRARLLASSLTIGAWVGFRVADETPVQRRLTVVLPSSGKYIFVEADGTGRHEISRDELVRGLAEGRIAPVGKDQKLDDALTRVVDNLRNERGQGGT